MLQTPHKPFSERNRLHPIRARIGRQAQAKDDVDRHRLTAEKRAHPIRDDPAAEPSGIHAKALQGSSHAIVDGARNLRTWCATRLACRSLLVQGPQRTHHFLSGHAGLSGTRHAAAGAIAPWKKSASSGVAMPAAH
jgi:hypothetical protein